METNLVSTQDSFAPSKKKRGLTNGKTCCEIFKFVQSYYQYWEGFIP